jgi:hypothetical protein
MRKVIIAFAIAALALVGTSTAFAGHGKVTPNASGTFFDGPYTAATADSGTCGNNWALDLFVRQFKVKLPANGDGSYTVTENFTKGHFNGFDGQSPGACEASGHGAHINEGVAGTFHGTETGKVTGGTFDPNGKCVKTAEDGYDQCNTSGWIAGFFGNGAAFNPDTFNFQYKANNPNLLVSAWTNADTGNVGDIASS